MGFTTFSSLFRCLNLEIPVDLFFSWVASSYEEYSFWLPGTVTLLRETFC
jgi:hypothetical protein